MVSCCERSCALLHLSPRGRRHHQQWVNRKKKAVLAPPCGRSLYRRLFQYPQVPPPRPSHPTPSLLDIVIPPSILTYLLLLLPDQGLVDPSHVTGRLYFVSFTSPSFSQPRRISSNLFPFCLPFSFHVAVITWRRIRTWRWPMRTRSSITARRNRRLILVSQRHARLELLKCWSPIWMH